MPLPIPYDKYGTAIIYEQFEEDVTSFRLRMDNKEKFGKYGRNWRGSATDKKSEAISNKKLITDYDGEEIEMEMNVGMINIDTALRKYQLVQSNRASRGNVARSPNLKATYFFSAESM